MSEEQLKAFLAKVKADASLQEQLKAEGTDVVAIAKAAGFTINTEDLHAHQQNLGNKQNLSDDELEGVSGGFYSEAGSKCDAGGKVCTRGNSINETVYIGCDPG